MKNTKTIKEKLMIALGLAMLPFAYTIWVVDRMMFTLMPQADHKNLNDWLTNKSVTYAFTRIITIVVIRYIIKWIFGV